MQGAHVLARRIIRVAYLTANDSNLRLFFSLALQPRAGYGLLVHEVFVITHNDASQSVGLPWTSDRLVADTST
jgi:hypothetical protein